MTPADVEQSRFEPARLGGSYDMRQVDEFLDVLHRGLADGRMPEAQVEATRFDRTWLREGYRAQEVDRFVDWARATVRAGAGSVYRPPARRVVPSSPMAVAGLVWATFVVGVVAFAWLR